MTKAAQEFPFVISYGAENFFLDEDLQRGLKYKGRNVMLLDGDKMKGSLVVDACETTCFDGSDRVIVLDNAHKVKADKTLKTYIEEKDVADTSVILVAICRNERLPEIWGTAAKKARIIEHKKLKTWDTKNEVIAYIPKLAKKLGLVLEKEVPEALYKFVGADLYKINNELRKLSVLVSVGGTATLDQLQSVCSSVFPVDQFQVVERAIQKDIARALSTLAILYQNVGEEASLFVCAALMRQVEKLIVARQMLDQKVPEDELAVQLDMHPYRLRQYFLPIVQKHTLPKLLRAMNSLCKLDMNVKGAGNSKRTLVELVVLEIAS